MKKLLIALLSIALINCESMQIGQEPENILSTMTIKSGQSFGMCIGPCYQEMVIEGSKITFIVKTRELRGNGLENSEQKYYDNLTATEESKLTSLMNTSLTAIQNSDEVIGCPDCADGGSEWIEIIENNSTEKVTFEFGHYPEKFKELTEFLYNKRSELAKKYVKTE